MLRVHSEMQVLCRAKGLGHRIVNLVLERHLLVGSLVVQAAGQVIEYKESRNCQLQLLHILFVHFLEVLVQNVISSELSLYLIRQFSQVIEPNGVVNHETHDVLVRIELEPGGRLMHEQIRRLLQH